MAQHITSVNDLYERTQAMGYTPDGTEKIYVVHGTGSDRDRVFELSQLGTYILNSADGFEFTDSISGGGQISTEVTAAGIEVAFNGSPSSKTTTIKYDYISTDTVKAKKIQGQTPSGAQDFKLVVTTGLDVGTQSENKPLHVNGETTLNGDTTVNGNTTIGSAGTNKNLTVNGNQTVTGTQTVNGKATFNGDVDIGAAGTGNGKTVTHFGLFQQNGDVGIIGNVEIGNPQGAKNLKVYGNFEATGKSTLPSAEIYNSLKVPFHKIVDAHTSYNMTTRQGEAIGNEVTVYNEAQTDKYVYILKKNVEYEAYVQFKIKSGHAMKFICTAVDNSVESGSPGASAWTALSNDDYEGV